MSWDPPTSEEELERGGAEAWLAWRGAGLPWLGGVCFFFRSVSIQLLLCREAKLASPRDDSLMFLPEVMSSPKPSW